MLCPLLLSPSKEVGDSEIQRLPLPQTTRKWASSPSSGLHSSSWNSTRSASLNEHDTNCWVGGNIIWGEKPSPFPKRCYFWSPSSMIKVGEVVAVGRLGEVWVGWVSAGQVPLGKFPWGGSGWQLSAGKLTRCDFKINGEIILCPWKSLGLING